VPCHAVRSAARWYAGKEWYIPKPTDDTAAHGLTAAGWRTRQDRVRPLPGPTADASLKSEAFHRRIAVDP
jgi:hypothetical protein